MSSAARAAIVPSTPAPVRTSEPPARPRRRPTPLRAAPESIRSRSPPGPTPSRSPPFCFARSAIVARSGIGLILCGGGGPSGRSREAGRAARAAGAEARGGLDVPAQQPAGLRRELDLRAVPAVAEDDLGGVREGGGDGPGERPRDEAVGGAPHEQGRRLELGEPGPEAPRAPRGVEVDVSQGGEEGDAGGARAVGAAELVGDDIGDRRVERSGRANIAHSCWRTRAGSIAGGIEASSGRSS